MKHFIRLSCCFMLAGLLLFLSSFALGEEKEPLNIRVRTEKAYGPADDLNGGGEAESYVFYPVLETTDESLLPLVSQINRKIQERAHIPEYVQLLSTLSFGGTGLQMDYQMGCLSAWTEENGGRIYDSVFSFLFSARGKMLSGRPSQVYYPLTIDLLTGEEVTFDQLFSDPIGAKEYIEQYLTDQLEPTLSTYMENNQLLPVPYDRFYLDSFGHVIIAYENSQLSFLSGASGAVSFRYSELSPWLDTEEGGVVSRLSWLGLPEAQTAGSLWQFLKGGALIPADHIISLGDSMDARFNAHPPAYSFHAAADSEFYPGGACIEVEEPVYRGALIITDENEETVTGILTSQWDFGKIQTGKTSLEDAKAFLETQPSAVIDLDEGAAEYYRVCPGSAAVYTVPNHEGEEIAFTLYADLDGVVQYVKLSIH